MAVLGEKAKEAYNSIVRNLWAYQSGFEKHKDLTVFDRSKIYAEAPGRKTFAWRMLYPTTFNGMVRSLGSQARFLLFGLALYSLYKKEEYLSPTEGAMFDRIDRRGYVRLPDGRLAQVNPQISTDLTPAGIWQTFKEMINPLP